MLKKEYLRLSYIDSRPYANLDSDYNLAEFNDIKSTYQVNYTWYNSFNGLIEQIPLTADANYTSDIPYEEQTAHYKKLTKLVKNTDADYKRLKGETVSPEYQQYLDSEKNKFNKWQDINSIINTMEHYFINLKGIGDAEFNKIMWYVKDIAYNQKLNYHKVHSRLSVPAIVLCIFKGVSDALGYTIKGFYNTKLCKQYNIKQQNVQRVVINLNQYT